MIDGLYIAVLAALALAFGLAFGLGGREAAGELTKGWAENAKQSAAKLQQTSPPKSAQAPIRAGDPTIKSRG